MARLEKAPTYGSDAIIADLEDGVAAKHKDLARSNLQRWLDECKPDTEIWVRINSDASQDDLSIAVHEKVSTIILPKTNGPDDVEALAKILASLEIERRADRPLTICALIESAEGVLNALPIARSNRVTRMILGELDLRADLGLPLRSGDDVLQFARNSLVFASAAARIEAPIASVSPNFKDLEAFEESSRMYADWGYFGRTCIHPNQITIANMVFSPSDREVEEAKDILRRLESSAGGAAMDSQGMMIDEAVARNARRIVELS
jgi:citrate lyase subunit beta/citryl-CoA lyase